ncbi:hypothetical protein [Pontibacter akesuensis]|uniref:SpoIIAA-like n=1 Tax=Pontibacter akesuensis TaxID=388950 RepID=A0A1I7KQ69_9BACT|nr:hypothetical protein [Pontibacter akesuensis]GHA81459.1 hypothetical protein GCM10007389_40040 [Pontibacter akesuensis]SFU99592.1 hypothetical protein SAMN04487941_3977 [Pontibacter akesuensis]
MVLHDKIIRLDYNPATDILETSMPDVTHFMLSEVKMCLDVIVTNIRNYDIKKLLLDASNSVIEMDEDDEAYKAVAMKFGMDLLGTRLKKIARVESADARREAKSEEARQQANLPMEFRNFSSRDEAMSWLLEMRVA